MNRVLYFGHVNIDVLLRVSGIPSRGESTEVVKMSERIGGTAYNAYKGLKSLGVPVDIFTVVGQDFEEKLDGYVIRGERTPMCWIVTDGKEQTAFVYQGLWKNKQRLNLDLRVLENYSHIHFSTGNPHFYLRVALRARELGKIIAFDPSQEIHYIYSKDIFKRMLSLSNFFFCNEREYEKALEFAPELLKRKIVIRTEGARGASLYSPTKGWRYFPAYKVDVVETTGAGDSFRAGFYAALYHGYSIEDAIKAGNWVASRVVSSSSTYYTGRWEELSESLRTDVSS